MLFPTWQVEAFFIICSVGNICLIIGILRWLCCEANFKWQPSKLLTSLCRNMMPRNTLDEKDAIIDRRIKDQKIRHLRVIMRVIAAFGIFWNTSFMAEIIAGESRDVPLIGASALLCSQIIASLATCFPWTLTPRTLDVFYSLLSLCFTITVSPVAVGGTAFLAPILSINGAMALLNGARRTVPDQSAPVFAICNVLFNLSSASSIFAYGSNFSSRPDVLACFQLIIGFVLCVCLAKFEESLRSYVKQHMQLQDVTELLEASCTLLRSCCQVVVEMDAAGIITSEDSDLSSFLLRGSGQGSLKGTALADLLVGEDRERFLLRFREMDEQRTGLAESLPVSMRDSCGNLLRLSLLWLRFNRSDGQYCMVGVREMAESWDQGPRGASDQEVPRTAASTTLAARDALVSSAAVGEVRAAVVPHAPLNGHGLSNLPPMVKRSSSRSSSSVPSDAASHARARFFDDSAAFLIVDCTQPHFPVRSATCGFGVRVARLPTNATIDSFVVEASSFKSWVQDSLNVIAYDLRPARDLCVELKIERRLLKAECKVITFMSDIDDKMPLNTSCVGLFFFGFKRVHRGTPIPPLNAAVPLRL